MNNEGQSKKNRQEKKGRKVKREPKNFPLYMFGYEESKLNDQRLNEQKEKREPQADKQGGARMIYELLYIMQEINPDQLAKNRRLRGKK